MHLVWVFNEEKHVYKSEDRRYIGMVVKCSFLLVLDEV